jgi:hypothetical protein
MPLRGCPSIRRPPGLPTAGDRFRKRDDETSGGEASVEILTPLLTFCSEWRNAPGAEPTFVRSCGWVRVKVASGPSRTLCNVRFCAAVWGQADIADL